MRRFSALVEVLVAFAAVHLSYRSFKHFTEIGRIEAAAKINFSAGSTMILFTVLVLLLCGRSFKEHGLTCRDWHYSLNVGLLWGVLMIGAAAAIEQFTHVRFDPLTPPDMTRAFVASAGGLGATFLLAWFLRRERWWLRRIPPYVTLPVLIALLLLPPALVWYSSRPLPQVFLTVLWLFFGAGFGEEIFFRGYIQSRVNQAFGRPFRLLGVEFGVGLIVSALLFGFIHAMNTVDYFHGRWEFASWGMLFNFVAGLFYGCLRERTGSIVAGGVLHGVFDVLARVPTWLP